jgi:hypothetical protein
MKSIMLFAALILLFSSCKKTTDFADYEKTYTGYCITETTWYNPTKPTVTDTSATTFTITTLTFDKVVNSSDTYYSASDNAFHTDSLVYVKSGSKQINTDLTIIFSKNIIRTDVSYTLGASVRNRCFFKIR